MESVEQFHNFSPPRKSAWSDTLCPHGVLAASLRIHGREPLCGVQCLLVVGAVRHGVDSVRLSE